MLTGNVKYLQNKKVRTYYNFFEIFRAHYIETISKKLCNVLKIFWQFYHKMKLCYSVIDKINECYLKCLEGDYKW